MNSTELIAALLRAAEIDEQEMGFAYGHLRDAANRIYELEAALERANALIGEWSNTPSGALIAARDEEIKALKEQHVFEQQWADKLKQFGTIDRLIEGYSAHKMESRRLGQENASLKAAIFDYLDWGAMTGSDRDMFHRKFSDLVKTVPATSPEKGDQ